MAVITMPGTSVEQPTESQSLGNTGGVTFLRSYKDTYTTLKTKADTIARGDQLGNNGPIITGYSLAKRPGDMGVLTFSLSPDDTSTSGETTVQDALLETWSLKSVRNDVSLLAYCGPSEGAHAHRTHIELWLKETDATLADADKYRKNDADAEGTSLTDADKVLVAKYRLGYESVIRVYPMLTKKRVYSRMPATVYEKLCYIDTPSVSEGSKEKEKPGNLASIISAHSWLKVQDDLEKNADGTFSRVESWMGVLTTERNWDENFYGSTNRWPMPYTGS